jgi:hypothetical protein
MRLILAFLLSLGFIGPASANRPVSGVVAVSTGPMQGFQSSYRSRFNGGR